MKSVVVRFTNNVEEYKRVNINRHAIKVPTLNRSHADVLINKNSLPAAESLLRS
jgi:hypothetical protein